MKQTNNTETADDTKKVKCRDLPAAASCAVTSSATVEEERRSESSKGLSGLDGGSLRSSVADIMEWLTTATLSDELISAAEFILADGRHSATERSCQMANSDGQNLHSVVSNIERMHNEHSVGGFLFICNLHRHQRWKSEESSRKRPTL